MLSHPHLHNNSHSRLFGFGFERIIPYCVRRQSLVEVQAGTQRFQIQPMFSESEGQFQKRLTHVGVFAP